MSNFAFVINFIIIVLFERLSFICHCHNSKENARSCRRCSNGLVSFINLNIVERRLCLPCLFSYTDAASLKKAIKAVKYEAGWTNTGEAMEKALAHYSAKMRKEKETAKVRGGWDDVYLWQGKERERER